MRTTFLLAVLSFSIHAAQTQLPSGTSLPPGMTMEQAKELARQNGATSAGASSTAGAAPASRDGGSIPQTIRGVLDSTEGILPGDSLRLDRIRRLPPRPDSTLRWGQTIFRSGDQSLSASYMGAVGPEYALGPGDEIILTLWGQKDARYQVELDRDGQVSIELVGVVSLNGQTLRSAEGLLRKRLTKVYGGLADGSTQMDVTLGKLKRVRVFVTGNVVRPGSFLLSGNTSVLAALFQAQGPNDLGTEREIEVRRDNQILTVDLYDYLARGKRPSRDILQDGDMVRVSRRGKVVTVKGDVGRPGMYELLAKEGAKDLLEYAGGTNATAASAHVVVQRVFENGRRDAVLLPTPAEIRKGAPAPLEDEDEVRVFPGKDPSTATIEIRGEVRFPGKYPATPDLTLGDLVEKAGGLTAYAYPWRVVVSRERSDSTRAILRQDLTQGKGPILQPRDIVDVENRVRFGFFDSVTLSGAVKAPGRYPWEDGMTVKDLILRGGGFLKRAEFGSLRLETPVPEREEANVELLSVDSSLAAGASDHRIAASAHLAVPYDPAFSELEFVQVRGWVAYPGRYALLRPEERISELIARAGGIKREGYVDGAKLLRKELGGARIQAHFRKALSDPGGKTDLPLRDGDTIMIPKTPATIEVRGRVNAPGFYVWQEGRSWKWYVEQAGGVADSANTDGVYVEYADGSVQTRNEGIRDNPNPGSVVIVPFRIPPEPVTFKETLGGINAVLATLLAGLTIYVLLQK